MYPNFPEEVQNKSIFELYLNAFFHYMTQGEYFPDIQEQKRFKEIDFVNMKELDLVSETEMSDILVNMIRSKDALSEQDKEYFKTLIQEFNHNISVESHDFTHREILTIYVAETSKYSLLKNSTDVLRLCTYLSEGDISLRENCKFTSFPRKFRKEIANVLSDIVNRSGEHPEWDFKIHQNKWVRLFHSLHIGDFLKEKYSKHQRLIRIVLEVRNSKIRNYKSKINEFISQRNAIAITDLLKNNPGDFVRSLGILENTVKSIEEENYILQELNIILNKVSKRVLIQVTNQVKEKISRKKQRTIYPIKGRRSPFPLNYVYNKDYDILESIEKTLVKELRSRTLYYNQKVYFEEGLNKIKIPLSQRTSSRGEYSFGRGSRFPIYNGEFKETDKSTIRFFVHWVGQDIDLSATFFDEEYKYSNYVGYHNLKADGIYHSGDITHAPKGASEFIDININKALKLGRFLALNVNVYNGPTFKEHEECYVGYMLRNSPNSNEIYDAKSVKTSFHLEGDGKFSVPLIFDLKTKEVIWLDRYFKSENSISAADSSVRESVSSILYDLDNDNSLSLLDLFTSVHEDIEVVKNKDEADILYLLNDEYEKNEGVEKLIVKANDIITINNKYL